MKKWERKIAKQIKKQIAARKTPLPGGSKTPLSQEDVTRIALNSLDDNKKAVPLMARRGFNTVCVVYRDEYGRLMLHMTDSPRCALPYCPDLQKEFLDTDEPIVHLLAEAPVKLEIAAYHALRLIQGKDDPL